MSTELEDQSSQLVLYAARLVRAVQRRVGHPAGIRILSLLDELGPLGVTEIAVADHSSQPTISGAVRQLEEQGWVSRSTDPADARRSVVHLSPAGVEALARARRENGVVVAEQLTATPHSVEEVAAAVALLRDLMDQEL